MDIECYNAFYVIKGISKSELFFFLHTLPLQKIKLML